MDTGQAERETKPDSDSDKDSILGDCEDLNPGRLDCGSILMVTVLLCPFAVDFIVM